MIRTPSNTNIASGDVELIARFTADDWVLIDTPGPIPRKAFHAVLSSGKLRHETMTHDVRASDGWRCALMQLTPREPKPTA